MKRPGAGDLLLASSVVAVVAAAAYPWVERASARRDAEAAVAAVEALHSAGRAFAEAEGVWPPSASSGQVPEALAAYLPEDFAPVGRDWTLGWERWERLVAPAPDSLLEEVPVPEGPPPTLPDTTAPPPLPVSALPGVSVRSRDPRVLARLLEHFGPTHSFVRPGSWTLVITDGDPR